MGWLLEHVYGLDLHLHFFLRVKLLTKRPTSENIFVLHFTLVLWRLRHFPRGIAFRLFFTEHHLLHGHLRFIFELCEEFCAYDFGIVGLGGERWLVVVKDISLGVALPADSLCCIGLAHGSGGRQVLLNPQDLPRTSLCLPLLLLLPLLWVPHEICEVALRGLRPEWLLSEVRFREIGLCNSKWLHCWFWGAILALLLGH